MAKSKGKPTPSTTPSRATSNAIANRATGNLRDATPNRHTFQAPATQTSKQAVQREAKKAQTTQKHRSK